MQQNEKRLITDNAQGLKQLKELNVASCKLMEGILMVSDEEKEAERRGMLPELKILLLEDLPKLGTIYNGEICLDLHCLEELQVWKCPNIKTLPLDSRSARKLRKFRAELAWFEGLQLKGEHTRNHLKSCLIEEYVAQSLKLDFSHIHNYCHLHILRSLRVCLS